MKKYLVGAFLFIALVMSGYGITVQAQDNSAETGNPGAFLISPVTKEISISPGQTIELSGEDAITVRNIRDQNSVAFIAIEDFTADNESGVPRLLAENEESPFSIKPFISITDSVQFAPNERVTVPLTISVPADAAPGAYYGLISFRTEPELLENQNVLLTATSGPLFLITVTGELDRQFSIEDFGSAQVTEQDTLFNARSFFTGGKIGSKIRIANTGNTFIKPIGKIQIKNMFGTVVEELEINQATPRGNILPGTSRDFTNLLSDRFYFGRYTMEANVSIIEDGGTIVPVTASFIVLPLWIIAVIAIVAIGITIFVRFVVPRHDKKVISKQKSRFKKPRR